MTIGVAAPRGSYLAVHEDAGLRLLMVRESNAPFGSRPRLLDRVREALGALLFLYREVLDQDLPWLDDLVRAKRRPSLPAVLTRDEVRAILDRLDGVPRLMGMLTYGAGLRVLECARLRVKDIEFPPNQLVVRDGKGEKDRVTMLPASVKRDLAVGVSRHSAVRGSSHRSAPSPSSARDRPSKSGEASRAPRRYPEACDLPHLPSFVRHPPSRGRPRHPNRPGTSRPQRRRDHHDLYPRPQPRSGRRAQPSRPHVRGVTPLMASTPPTSERTGGWLTG